MKKKSSQQFVHLHKKWSKRHSELKDNLWSKHKSSLDWILDKTKHLAVGSLGSLMLLITPVVFNLPIPHPQIVKEQLAQEIDRKVFLISDLSHILPDRVRSLTSGEEDTIAQTLTRTFGFRVTAQLEEKRLNRSYGYIGAEQHLARFPGDNMSTHFDTQAEVEKYFASGMAPGLGAWGYFASENGLTEQDKLREKYYIAVQTFLAPGFNENPRELIDFFKYRKMLVVNPNNGKAVVTVIGDAGPAEWTGKHLGGSPEVMSYLERFDGKAKGVVLYFFIDDPDDKIPLGPIIY